MKKGSCTPGVYLGNVIMSSPEVLQLDKLIVSAAEAAFFSIGKLFAAPELFPLFHCSIETCLVYGDRIGGTENSDVTGTFGHWTRFAIASAGDVHGKGHIYVFFPFCRTAGIFDQFFPEKSAFEKRVPESAQGKYRHRMGGTDGKTSSAADALAAVDTEFS